MMWYNQITSPPSSLCIVNVMVKASSISLNKVRTGQLLTSSGASPLNAHALPLGTLCTAPERYATRILIQTHFLWLLISRRRVRSRPSGATLLSSHKWLSSRWLAHMVTRHELLSTGVLFFAPYSLLGTIAFRLCQPIPHSQLQW